jgi:hypothetical protein
VAPLPPDPVSGEVVGDELVAGSLPEPTGAAVGELEVGGCVVVVVVVVVGGGGVVVDVPALPLGDPAAATVAGGKGGGLPPPKVHAVTLPCGGWYVSAPTCA